jgi:hypothetical protein
LRRRANRKAIQFKPILLYAAADTRPASRSSRPRLLVLTANQFKSILLYPTADT